MLFALLAFGLASPAFAQSSEQLQSNPQIEAAEELHKSGYNFFIQREHRKALESFLKELPLRRAARDTVGEAWAVSLDGRELDGRELDFQVNQNSDISRSFPAFPLHF